MASNVYWIKISTAMFSNRKINIILHERDGDSLFRIWIQLLIIAGECNNKGKLLLTDNTPMCYNNLAKIMRKNVNKVQKAIQLFLKLEMLVVDNNTFVIKNWDKYQSADKLEEIRASGRERQRRFREREKSKGNVLVTLCNDDTKSKDKTKEENNTKDSSIKECENATGFRKCNY